MPLGPDCPGRKACAWHKHALSKKRKFGQLASSFPESGPEYAMISMSTNWLLNGVRRASPTEFSSLVLKPQAATR